MKAEDIIKIITDILDEIIDSNDEYFREEGNFKVTLWKESDMVYAMVI